MAKLSLRSSVCASHLQRCAIVHPFSSDEETQIHTGQSQKPHHES